MIQFEHRVAKFVAYEDGVISTVVRVPLEGWNCGAASFK